MVMKKKTKAATKKKDNLTFTWRLDLPEHCREFLKSVRAGKEQKRIQYLECDDGTLVSIDRASDAQVVTAANKIAQAMYKRRQSAN